MSKIVSEVIKMVLKLKKEMSYAQKGFAIIKIIVPLLLKDILLVLIFWFALSLLGVSLILYGIKPIYTATGSFSVSYAFASGGDSKIAGIKGFLSDTLAQGIDNSSKGTSRKKENSTENADSTSATDVLQSLHPKILSLLSTPKISQKIIDMSFMQLSSSQLSSMLTLKGDAKKSQYTLSCSSSNKQKSYDIASISMKVVMQSVNDMENGVTTAIVKQVSEPLASDNLKKIKIYCAFWIVLSLIVTLVVVVILDGLGLIGKAKHSSVVREPKFKDLSTFSNEIAVDKYTRQFKKNFMNEHNLDYMADLEVKESYTTTKDEEAISTSRWEKEEVNSLKRLQIAALPLSVPIVNGGIYVKEHPFIPISESFKQLRTLLFTRYKLKTLMICSALSGEGKSMTVSNLAALSAFSGKKTLIIDFDIRYSNMQRIFDIEPQEGVLQYLNEDKDLIECIMPSDIKNLHILPTGSENAHCFEIANERKMSELKIFVESHYDMIFIDVPPLLEMGDSLFLFHKFSQCIVIQDSKISSKEVLDECYKRILFNQGEIIGVVKNRMKLRETAK